MTHASVSRQALLLIVAAAVLAIGVALPAHAKMEIEELFRRFDVNNDGRISRDEFEVKKVEIIFQGSTSRGARLTYAETNISRAAFDEVDSDKDGVITADEAIASPLFRFETWDTNRDGYIDFNEFAAQLRRIER